MARNDGRDFELMVRDLFDMLNKNPSYTSVEHNVQLVGHDGPRQIDILIRAQVTSLDLLTIIECRDHTRRLDVTTVDALHSKMQDVRASKAVLVSRAGFSKKAQQKAERLGITLCIAAVAREALWNVGLEVPIILREIKCSKCYPEFDIHLTTGIQLPHDCGFTVCDCSLEDTLARAIQSEEIPFPEKDTAFAWKPLALSRPFIRDQQSVEIPLENFVVHVELKTRYFFGYVKNLPNTKILRNISEKREHVFVDKVDVGNYESTLKEFRSLDLIPRTNAAVVLSVLAIHPPRIEHATFKLTHAETGDSYDLDVTGSRFAQ